MMPLPNRVPRPISNIQKLTKFSEFIDKSDDEIINNGILYTLFIDDFKILKENFNLFKKIILLCKIEEIFSKDFECLKYIENNLDDYTNIKLSLIDDFKIKDRSYLDLQSFQKTTIEIPLSYVLWNPLLQENQKISLYYTKNSMHPFCSNGYEYISLEKLKKIREIVYKLAQKYQELSSVEKTILISNYIQNNVQYIDKNNVSMATDGTFITDSKGLDITYKLVGSPETVLLQNFGLCNGIANATTLLLNNPYMNVNVHSVFGDSHVWNIVCIDGKYYYIDNTWSITRNKDRYPESLKAKSFSSDYLLFGTNTASQIGHHNPSVYCPVVEQKDFDKEKIDDIVQKKLIEVDNFSNYQKPIFKSYIKK